MTPGMRQGIAGVEPGFEMGSSWGIELGEPWGIVEVVEWEDSMGTSITVLVCSSCRHKDTIDWWLIKKDIYLSQFWSLGSPKSIPCLVRARCLARRHLTSHERLGALWDLFYRGVSPVPEAPPYDSTSQRFRLQIPSLWALG